MMKVFLTLLLLAGAAAQTGSIQLTPTTSTLWAQSSYQVSYYTFYNMPSTSTFALNFSNTYITVPNGTINISAVISGVSVASPSASCSGAICTLRLNKVAAANTNIKITIGSFVNPYFLRSQPITANVTFNASYTEYPTWTIPSDMYTPMPITSNSLTQSDYGVGNTGVNYLFNFSVPMSPASVQLSLTIPSQVSVETLQTSLVYYGVVQYAVPVLVNNIIVLNFNATFVSATSPTGFIFLNVSGLINPQSMGSSSSFVLQILTPTLPGSTTTCSNCVVAQITSSLFAQSTVPGNIVTINMFSSSGLIGQQNNITIYSKLYASIPSGGIYQILLPSSVRPVLPVYCTPMYGFTIVNSGTPSCSYNSTNNAIYTNNFVFSGSGSVVLAVGIVNPPDTTQANFYFQSFDAAANMIGNSTSPYPITASPLPLTASASKSNYQVQSTYKLTVNCTLGVALSSSNRIQVILPQASYNISAIVCSVGTTVPCTTSIDPMTQNLTLNLTPPCSPCSVGTTFTFTVEGLINPSFINAYSQAVVVQSATTTGIIQTNSLPLTLSPSSLTVGGYSRSGNNTVGSTYSMTFTYTVSSYISANGGMLLINFNQLDTYVNPVTATDGTYTYPTTLTVTDAQSNTYTNSLNYYTTSSPNSLQQIAINICGTYSCTGNITVWGLRKGFSPLASLTQNIQITTVFGDSVSTSTFNIVQFNVAKVSKTLGISLSNSVTTLGSNYVLDFVSVNTPFQSGLVFSFSSLHTINGGCFLTHNGSTFNGVFSCQVLNSSSISLTYSGDITLMMLETIDYTLTILNVTNPISIVPITYQLSTQFSSTVNSQFTTIYSIQTAFPLNFLMGKSNNTFGQAAIMNLTIVSNYPSFNQIKIAANSSLLTILPTSSASTSYLASIANNAYQISQIYSLSNQSIILNIVNPNTTAISGTFNVSMYNAGYLSAFGIVSVPNVAPMFLGLSAATTSRVVGDTCNLTVNLLRVNSYSSQSQFMLNISPTLYDLSSATYNGNPTTFPLAFPIGLTSVTVSNLKNLQYVPLTAPATGVNAWTLDASNAVVATTSYSPTGLAPNTPSSPTAFAFTRTNTVINGVGSIVVSYTPRFASSIATMNITLPQSQSSLVSPACSLNSQPTCTVLASDSTYITLKFLNQTTTTLTNIVNIQPNSNQMKVTMLTANNELVETATAAITPSIQYNQLTLSASVSSPVVATTNQIQIGILSPSKIDMGSKIVINLPNGTFTRLSSLISQDCTYSIGGANFTGCLYGVQNSWLNQVNITALGGSQIAANTAIALTLYLTNSWSISAFASQALTVLISNPSDSFVAQGSISLAAMFGGIPSLTAAVVGTPAFSQSSTQANTNNSVAVSFTLPVPLTVGSTLVIWLPKSAYYLSAVNTALLSNLQTLSDNSTYYSLTLGVACPQTSPTPLCTLANAQYSQAIPLQNNPFSQIQNSPIGFQVQLSGNPISAQPLLAIPSFTPQPLSAATASISRSNLQAFASTNISIIIPTPVGVSSFTLMVAPLTKGTATVPIILSPTFAGVGSTQTYPIQLNSSNFVLVNVSGATGTSSVITISGQNNLLTSSSEAYTVTLLDSSYVYFTGQVTPSDTLLPYSTGLSLQRTTTTVGKNTNIYLYGSLPVPIPPLSVAFNGNSYTVSGSIFNVSLGTMLNNNNISDSSIYPITIKNSDYTAFSSALSITPALTAQNLTSLVGLIVPSVVSVTANFNITVSLNSTALTYLTLKTPPYFKALSGCCIDAACNQTFIQSCILTQGSTNLIELWLSSSQTVSSIVFQVSALDYQSSFSNQTTTITSALPTSSISLSTSIVIAAANVTASLAVLNWKVNSVNNYTLSVKPIAKTGYLQITLPSFISSQFAANSNNSSLSLTINGSVSNTQLVNVNGTSTLTIPVTPASTNVLLLLSSIINPPDNTPYTIVATQATDQTFINVYGYSALPVVMNQFDLITINSAIRIVTKVNVATNLILEASTPYANAQFVITFPVSQLLTTSVCTVVANEGDSLPCQVLDSSSIMTTSLAGTNRYTITGLKNQKYFSPTNTQDLLTAQLGTPYTKATTLPSSSTPVSPQLTLGSIVVNSMLSSSSVMLASTSLTYNITIENTNNINGFFLIFNSYYYIFSPSIACAVNALPVSCAPIDNQTLFIPYANPESSNLLLTVRNIVNFIKPTNWTLKSVNTYQSNGATLYSDVDLYYNDGTALPTLQSAALALRVIMPYNYVQASSTFQLIIDSKYSSFLPLSSFALNFTTQTSACQLVGANFTSTLSVTCSFPQSISYNMKLQLYHKAFPATPLSVGTANLFIYPAPGGGCSNQMCDSCSYSNGQQYCFACREGLYSSNGQCQSSCNSGNFPYAGTNICQPCSPTCSSCFGLYSTNCLSCTNASLTLDSGTCVDGCSAPSYAYGGYCVNNEECSGVSGCRLCSGSGFCYQCLPDYTGAPTCKYVNVMPQTIMIYILAPFLVMAVASIIVAAAKCVGADSLLSQAIFSFSMVELFAWAFTVPIMPNIMMAMTLVSFFTLRIIISIVSYEVFYKKNMGELSEKLLEEESQKEISAASQDKKEPEAASSLHNWKTKLVRLIAHFNGPDSYELLKCKIAEPVLSVSGSLAIDAIFMANRWIVCFLMFYMVSIGTVGDSVIMPIMVIVNGLLVSLCRLISWDKVRKCLSACRS